MGSRLAGAIDVTVPFSPLVPTWPTHPTSRVEPMRRIAAGDPSNVSLVAVSSHAGTHVDAHWHVLDDGAKLPAIPLARWCGPCHVARIPDEIRRIGAGELEAAGIPLGSERLLLRTANSAEWASLGDGSPVPFREDYVGVAPDGARWIVDRGIRLVGIDYLSVGPYGEENRETHRTLLGNDVLIVETLDLSAVAPGPYELVCLPLRLEIGDGAPARVVLLPPA